MRHTRRRPGRFPFLAAATVVFASLAGIAPPTPAGRQFLQAEATWSGAADVDVLLIDPAGHAVGQVLPAGCESTASRTERVVFQGTILAAGTYQVRLTGKTCSGGGSNPIATLIRVESDSGPKSGCQDVFANVPVGGTITGCTFAVP
jgi:hypothetical protein